MPPDGPDKTPLQRLRWRLFIVLEAGRTGDLPSRIFDAVMVALIVGNVVAFALETVPQIRARFGPALTLFEIVSVLIFTIEYLLRLWVCVELHPYAEMRPLRARLRFAVTPFMVIDLLAVLPFYLAALIAIDLRVLRVFRLLRFLKLVRYSPALSSLWGTLVAERRALSGALIVMLGMLMLSSTLLYFLEGAVQPDAFGTVPAAMWWGIATLTTVGYGDVVPVTAAGKFVGGLVMIIGLGMFALPIGIIATGWSQQIHRREFVVTWGMLSRVPLFSGLDAMSIAEIMSLLRTRITSPGEILVTRNEIPRTMFFISDGRVDVEWPDRSRSLGDGDFFGAISLLKGLPSPATLRARGRTHLLCIDAEDFRSLLNRDEVLRRRILDVAESRLDEGWMQDETAPQSEAPPPAGITAGEGQPDESDKK